MLEEIVAGVVQQIISWAMQFPTVATILMVVGALRVVMKPLMSFLRVVVEATTFTDKDNILLDNVEKSKVYTTFLYILDWFASIKPPVK